MFNSSLNFGFPNYLGDRNNVVNGSLEKGLPLGSHRERWDGRADRPTEMSARPHSPPGRVCSFCSDHATHVHPAPNQLHATHPSCPCSTTTTERRGQGEDKHLNSQADQWALLLMRRRWRMASLSHSWEVGQCKHLTLHVVPAFKSALLLHHTP